MNQKKIYYNFVFIFQFLGAFELAVIRMSRYYDLSQNAVLFGDFMLPMEAFMTTRDTTEMKLVSQIFDFARALAEFRLSDEQLALYSGYILLQDGEYLFFNLCPLVVFSLDRTVTKDKRITPKLICVLLLFWFEKKN